MNKRILSLICDPDTHDSLDLRGEALVNPGTGKRYAIRDGIPVFLETVTGQNRKYQELYDRIAILYDPAMRLYRWLKPKVDFRKIYMDELEVRDGARALEVSVGTGLNIPYLRPDVELFGLDLSWGMLRRCRKNLRAWNRTAELFQGEAERLPFRDATFDVVFHVGGINFFNDKARAIREMIRVAKPGTKIVIVDETEQVVKQTYERLPVVRKYFRKRSEAVVHPLDLVPPAMQEARCRELFKGRIYCLTFRKP